MTDDRKKTWVVEGVIPKEHNGDKSWARNINLQVVAVTMEECIDAVKAKYPHMKLVKVFSDRYIEDVIVAGE